MEEETKPNEELNAPKADQPVEAGEGQSEVPAESPAPAEGEPEAPAKEPAPEAPAEGAVPEAPAEEAPVAPAPAPAPANTPAQPVVVPKSHVQNAVDVMEAPADTSKDIAQQLTEDAKKQKEFFMAQPKVIMNIPLKEGEKRGAYESVCVNGYRLQIPKGVSVKLPEGVAEILAEFYNIQLGTGAIPEEAEFSADRNEKTAAALA